MSNITAVTAVKGSCPHLEESLQSVSGIVKEIIVANLGISPELLKALKSNKLLRVIDITGDVPYIELIRESLKAEVKTEYVLFIDPDEVLPLSLAEYIEKHIAEYDFISLPRKNMIFGKWVQHSRWWPDYQVRVFKKSAVTWPKEIHQQPTTSGNGTQLDAKEQYAIIHHNYENLDEYLQKAMRYAKAEAQETIAENRTLTLPQTVKKALSEFMSRFFFEEGFRDGSHGFVLATLQLFYTFLVYFYYWEKKKYFEESPEMYVSSMKQFFGQGLFETNHWQSKKMSVTLITQIKMKVQSFFIK